jgi:hypothetical protein
MYLKLANGLRDVDGFERNKELLVSYGKGYWRGIVPLQYAMYHYFPPSVTPPPLRLRL